MNLAVRFTSFEAKSFNEIESFIGHGYAKYYDLEFKFVHPDRTHLLLLMQKLFLLKRGRARYKIQATHKSVQVRCNFNESLRQDILDMIGEFTQESDEIQGIGALFHLGFKERYHLNPILSAKPLNY
jgi:hypothetical protein